MKKIEAVGLALYDDDHTIFVAQRPKGKALEDKWEFPGGKLEVGESIKECIHREIQEELCIQATLTHYLGKRTFVYNYGVVTLHLFMGITKEKEAITLVEHQDGKWVKPNDLSLLDMPEVSLPFIGEIEKILRDLRP